MAEWRKVSVTSAISAICVIKNGVLIFREKGCWKQFLRTFEMGWESVRRKSVGWRWWGYQVIRWIRIIEWKRIDYADLLFEWRRKNKEIVFRVFRVYRVNEKCPKYPIYPKYPCYIFAEIAVCAHRNVRIGGSGTSRTSDSSCTGWIFAETYFSSILSGVGVVTVLL